VAPSSAFNAEVPRFHYIHHLEVRDALKRKGVGTALMQVVLKQIRAQGTEPWIWLCANAKICFQDTALMTFYERLGFRRLAPGTAMMYWDKDYSRRVLVDPKVGATQVPYMPS
jgi:GNAT superfamily N-acetyltransferase